MVTKDTDTPETLQEHVYKPEHNIRTMMIVCKQTEGLFYLRACNEAAEEMENAYEHLAQALSIYTELRHETEQNSD